MKYLLVLIVVGVFYLYWKKQRSRPVPPPSSTTSLETPQPMVRCTHCGVLLPAKDAVLDAQQHPFCSISHQQKG